jgi:predicted RNA-binding protein Jag
MERIERLKRIVTKTENWFLTLSQDDIKILVSKYPDIFEHPDALHVEVCKAEGLLDKFIQETNKEIEIENNFRYNFKCFFQGDEYGVPPCGSLINVTRFGITDLKFTHTESSVNVDISLSFPGLLIGKGGSIIDSLNTFLNDRAGVEFKLNLIEKVIWRLDHNI